MVTMSVEGHSDGRDADSSRHPTVAERTEAGRSAGGPVPRSSHREWVPVPGRPDPVQVLAGQNEGRVPWLVPLRHARMQVSPFAFYRATAEIMAGDLAAHTDQRPRSCSSAATPTSRTSAPTPRRTRELIFDANDFDETLPGPWEWDVKRLATSFTILGQSLGFDRRDCRQITSRRRQVLSQGNGTVRERRRPRPLVPAHGGRRSPPRGATDLAADLAKRLKRFERKAVSRTSLQALGQARRRGRTAGTASAAIRRCCSRCATSPPSTTHRQWKRWSSRLRALQGDARRRSPSPARALHADRRRRQGRRRRERRDPVLHHPARRS